MSAKLLNDYFAMFVELVENMADTDITAVDYRNRKAAIKSMLERGKSIASFLILSGENAYEDFIPDEDFLNGFREKYFSYDESSGDEEDE